MTFTTPQGYHDLMRAIYPGCGSNGRTADQLIALGVVEDPGEVQRLARAAAVELLHEVTQLAERVARHLDPDRAAAWRDVAAYARTAALLPEVPA